MSELAPWQQLLSASTVAKTGTGNETEAAYAATLSALHHAGEVGWFKFEGIKLRLADNTFYPQTSPSCWLTALWRRMK